MILSIKKIKLTPKECRKVIEELSKTLNIIVKKIEEKSESLHNIYITQGEQDQGLINMYITEKNGITLSASGNKNPELCEKLLSAFREYISPESITGADAAPGDDNFAGITDEIKRIGTDESGKGDFFGPLVTAGFFVSSKEMEKKLINLGIKDSKKVSDSRATALAKELYKTGTGVFVEIGNKKYNELYSKMNNLNIILAWSHARVIENLLKKFKCKVAIADQFGNESLIKRTLFEKGRQINLIQETHAERDLAVAAASIIARAVYLDRLKKLGKKMNMQLPKGAGSNVIDIGLTLAKTKGIEVLNEVAKIHFKTYDNIKNEL